MARWQNSLRIADEWKLAKNGEITTQELASRISVKIAALNPVTDDEGLEELRIELADNFKALSEDIDGTVDDFDGLMSDLYDWADTPLDDHFGGKKLCWVATF